MVDAQIGKENAVLLELLLKNQQNYLRLLLILRHSESS